MKTKEKESYLAPACQIVTVSETNNLMDTSFPSQHRKANKASGPAAQAKSFGLWSDEHFEDSNSENANNDGSSSWDD